jgi:hypothetical protein
MTMPSDLYPRETKGVPWSPNPWILSIFIAVFLGMSGLIYLAGLNADGKMVTYQIFYMSNKKN